MQAVQESKKSMKQGINQSSRRRTGQLHRAEITSREGETDQNKAEFPRRNKPYLTAGGAQEKKKTNYIYLKN